MRFVVLYRIHEGRVPYRDWIRCDGIRRLIREADLHPYQQHHRRIWLRWYSPNAVFRSPIVFCFCFRLFCITTACIRPITFYLAFGRNLCLEYEMSLNNLLLWFRFNEQAIHDVLCSVVFLVKFQFLQQLILLNIYGAMVLNCKFSSRIVFVQGFYWEYYAVWCI